MTSLRERFWRLQISRELLCILIFMGVMITSYGLELRCGKGSEKCRSTWLASINTRTIGHEHGSNMSRDCFDFDRWNSTQYGDTGLSLTSFYFIAPLPLLSVDSFSTVAISLYIGITSFLFHATYGEESRMYDIIGIRVATFAVSLDFIFKSVRDQNLSVPLIGMGMFLTASKASALLILGYVTWFQWRIMPADWDDLLGVPGFKDDTTTVWYNLVPVPWLLYAFWRLRADIRALWKSLLGGLLCLGAGVGCLVASRDSHCPRGPQTFSVHGFGHLFVAAGLVTVARFAGFNKNKKTVKGETYSLVDLTMG